MTLPTGSQVHLDLTLNAGSARADLGAMQLPELGVTVNAGEATIDASEAAGTSSVDASVNAGKLSLALGTPDVVMTGDLSANAGSIEVCVPDGVGLRIRTAQQPARLVQLLRSGLTHEGDEWIRTGANLDAHRIDLSVSANLGSITLNPESGCD